MRDFFIVLVGGICSAIGGCVAIWYQAKKARKIRMEELRGEQTLEACKKALSLIGQIQTLLIQSTTEDVLKLLYDNGEWFSMNQILLPHKFVENWRSIILNLKNKTFFEQAARQRTDGIEHDKGINGATKTFDFSIKLAKEAEEILRKELNLPEVKIKTPETK
jgi:hypothetical protein